MALVHLDTILVAPVPVGHRVRITWYGETSTGLFGGSTTEEFEYEPRIEDLDSGVEYASERLYSRAGGRRHGIPVDVQPRIVADAQRSIEGIVRSCRVITVCGYAEVDVQTHLTVEVP